MSNIISNLSDWLHKNTTLYVSLIQQNAFVYENNDEIMAQLNPSEGSVTVYFDKSRSSTCSISYFTKSLDQELAERELTKIVNLLSQRQVEIEDGCIENIEIDASPSFQGKDDSNCYVFSATITVSYNI